ncbi:MAG TPA: thiamine-phosphate kinase [Sedimentisphaerales bacterium]|nr:thiamine-phosphate kinase [Sedimentisphaerales bacterium]
MTEWFALQRKLSVGDFPIGIGDDMAQIELAEGVSVLITTDMLLDGVHFDLKKVTLEQVGYKAMAASISDCAAMATLPVAAVVSVALPRGFGEEQLRRLHRGIILAGDKFNCALVGGDITSWPDKEPFAISVAMLSRTAGNQAVRRSGAKVGDAVCVTGSLGGSGCGRHLEFEPRVKEAIKLAHIVRLNSMIDISDGLSTDLNRICRQSKVGALVEAELIPISDPARQSGNPLVSALNDGEDFELLFTLSEGEFQKLLRRWDGSTTITRIGTITDTAKMQIRMADGRISDLQPGGYDHLAK